MRCLIVPPKGRELILRLPEESNDITGLELIAPSGAFVYIDSCTTITVEKDGVAVEH